MAMVLMLTALLTFMSTGLVLHHLKLKKAKLEKVEFFKSRIGLQNRYQVQQKANKKCLWCDLGLFIGPRSHKEREAIRQLLVRAGFRDERHLGAYFFLKYSAVLLSMLLVLVGWSWFQMDPIIALIVPVVVLMLPERLMMMLSKHRLHKVNLALPDFLDMANICMTAGLTYLEAIKRVSKELNETYPEICFEFQQLIEQIKIGVPRQEALKQFAERNATRDIQELVQVLIQNEKLGSPIAAAVSDFSRRMYQTRENLMEEKAAKTAAKMAIVMLPFLMLPYFILMLGEKFVMLGRAW